MLVLLECFFFLSCRDCPMLAILYFSFVVNCLLSVVAFVSRSLLFTSMLFGRASRRRLLAFAFLFFLAVVVLSFLRLCGVV